MQRLSTTVVALVGSGPAPAGAPSSLAGLVDAVGSAANVHAIVAEPASPTERAVAALEAARRSRRTYVVHDADPLEAVAAAWVDLFDAVEPGVRSHPPARGRLETVVADVVARWRGQSLELPDFYLVVGAADLPATRRHWYLGFLRGHAPHRLVLADRDAAAIQRALGRLPAGRWWPDLPRLLDGVDRMVPDVSEATGAEEGTSLVVPSGGGEGEGEVRGPGPSDGAP